MDFAPFIICPPGTRPPKPRHPGTPEGLGDRMRTAAFAERQAVLAFTWAAATFADAPPQLCRDWLSQVPQEQRHYEMIVGRMAELGFDLTGRPVSAGLWASLQTCTSAGEFCCRIAAAEERGRQAALRLITFLAESDPATCDIFRQIAADEVAHVALATTYFGWTPGSD